MRLGLTVSLILHAAILAWALITLRSGRDFKPPVVLSIEAPIVTESELVEMRKGNPDAKPDQGASKDVKSETQKPTKAKKVAALPPPPKSEPKTDPAPKEEPKPEDTKKTLEEMAKSEPKAEPKPEPEAKPEPPKAEPPKADPIAEKLTTPEPPPGPSPEELKKAEEARQAEEAKKAEAARKAAAAKAKKLADAKAKKIADAKAAAAKKANEAKVAAAAAKTPRFDPDGLAKTLLDKDPNAGKPPPQQAAAEPARTPGPLAGAREGSGTKLSGSEILALGSRLSRQVKPCLTVLGGAADGDKLQVRVLVRFKEDGTVIGQPQVLNPQNSALFLAASDRVISAIMQCQPYNMPAEKFEHWRESIMSLDQKDLF
jgi:colicin import membrane protein